MDKAQQVSELFNGTHDFRTFCFEPKAEENTVRTLDVSLNAELDASFANERNQLYDIYQIHFKSHSFLYNQVRRMVGAMITYATYDQISLDDIRRMLDEPSSGGWKTKVLIAEPYGLFLKRLNYNKQSEYFYSFA